MSTQTKEAKMDTEKEAMEKADDLLKELDGKGWTAKVWENLGWWASVFNGGLNIYIDVDEETSCGCTDWTLREDFTDPNEAIQKQLTKAREHTEARMKVIEAIEKRVLPKKETK